MFIWIWIGLSEKEQRQWEMQINYNRIEAKYAQKANTPDYRLQLDQDFLHFKLYFARQKKTGLHSEL